MLPTLYEMEEDSNQQWFVSIHSPLTLKMDVCQTKHELLHRSSGRPPRWSRPLSAPMERLGLVIQPLGLRPPDLHRSRCCSHPGQHPRPVNVNPSQSLARHIPSYDIYCIRAPYLLPGLEIAATSSSLACCVCFCDLFPRSLFVNHTFAHKLRACACACSLRTLANNLASGKWEYAPRHH